MKPVPIKPIKEEYNIPEDILVKYNSLQKELEEYRKNIKEDKVTPYILLCSLVFVVSVVSHWINEGGSIDFEDILYLLLSVGVAGWIPGVFLMIIVSKIRQKYNYGKEKIILKEIRNIEPIVKSYDRALNNYSSEMDHYLKMYEGIQNVNYDRDKYIKSKENYLLIKINMEMDYLENLTKERWWFNLSPLEFENQVAEWYRRQGYDAKTTSYVADGGYDIILTKDNQKTYVQCKHYKNKSSIGVSVIRELLGVITADRVSKGILVCLCKPTQKAMEFAHKNGIQIVMVSELAAKDNTIKLDRTIRYIPEETYIGSLKPYLYIGDIGVIYNVFYYEDDAQEYARMVRSNGVEATYYQIGNLYYIISSNSALLTKLRFKTGDYICNSRYTLN